MLLLCAAASCLVEVSLLPEGDSNVWISKRQVGD